MAWTAVFPKLISILIGILNIKSYLVRALNAPFNKRTVLRRRGYRWRPADQFNGKVWWTETKDIEKELSWLKEEIYNKGTNIPTRKITALNRYSDRIWEL